MGILSKIADWINGRPNHQESDDLIKLYSNLTNRPEEEPFIWYFGDPRVLNDYYAIMRKQYNFGLIEVDKWRFWGYPKLNIRKIHSGLPKTIVKTLTSVVFGDGFTVDITGCECDTQTSNPDNTSETPEFSDNDNQTLMDAWSDLDSRFRFSSQLIKTAFKKTLIYGDGAFKFSFKPKLTPEQMQELIQQYTDQYSSFNLTPSQIQQLVVRQNMLVDGLWLEYVDKTQIADMRWQRGEVYEIDFETVYTIDSNPNSQSTISSNAAEATFILTETYGKGYIFSTLERVMNDTGKREQVPLTSIPQTANLMPIWTAPTGYDKLMAIPVLFDQDFANEARGTSLFDGTYAKLDALDELLSEWMDAYRKGQVKHFIPESMVPHNPETGEAVWTGFDEFSGVYIKTKADMSEGQNSKIDTVQPTIDFNRYATGYQFVLCDLCQQFGISRATLGIETSQRESGESLQEKEKLTISTRNYYTDCLSQIISDVVTRSLELFDLLENANQLPDNYDVTITFSDYETPTFNDRVDVISKANPGTQLMSVESKVDALWSDTKTDDWKSKEVERIKAEQGLATTEDDSPQLEDNMPDDTSEDELDDTDDTNGPESSIPPEQNDDNNDNANPEGSVDNIDDYSKLQTP